MSKPYPKFRINLSHDEVDLLIVGLETLSPYGVTAEVERDTLLGKLRRRVMTRVMRDETCDLPPGTCVPCEEEAKSKRTPITNGDGEVIGYVVAEPQPTLVTVSIPTSPVKPWDAKEE